VVGREAVLTDGVHCKPAAHGPDATPRQARRRSRR
jgi:hypothetical protein